MSGYIRDINKILDEIWELWEGGSFYELAEAADLHYSTVVRLMIKETKCPYYRTVWKLAHAVGMQLKLTSVQKLRRAM